MTQANFNLQAGAITGKANPLAFLQGFNRVGSAKNNTNSPANQSGGQGGQGGPKRGKINLLTQGVEGFTPGVQLSNNISPIANMIPRDEGMLLERANLGIPSLQFGGVPKVPVSGAGNTSNGAAEDAYDNPRPSKINHVTGANHQDERMKYLLKFGKVLWAGPDYNSVFVELPQIPGVSIYYRKDVLRDAGPER